MPQIIPVDRTEAVLATVAARPTGAAFITIAATLEPTPRKRILQHWQQTLVRQRGIIRVEKTKATRYQLAVPPAKRPTLFRAHVKRF